MSAVAPWLRQRERGSVHLLRLMLWLTTRLGAGVGRALLRPIALYFLLTGAAPRAASVRYLTRVLGRPPTWHERFRHFLTFAQTIMDRILLHAGQAGRFVVDIEGLATVEALVARGRGFVLLGAHMGSFEVLRTIVARHCPVPVRIMMHGDNASRLHGFLRSIDAAADVGVIHIGDPDAALHARDTIEAGGIIGILGDRCLAGSPTASVDFLGGHASFPTGPFALAALLQVPVVLFFGLHRGERRYVVQFELLAERIILDRGRRTADLTVWVARYADAVARRCHSDPFNWFNFYDFWFPPRPTTNLGGRLALRDDAVG